MAGMKTASFTVRASMPQSIAWKRAAESEGFASCGAWLARAADAYLRLRVKAGLPLPLAWRHGTVRVRLDDGREPELRGWVSPPFGTFHGSAEPVKQFETRVSLQLGNSSLSSPPWVG